MRRALSGALTVITVLAAVVSVSGQAAQSNPSIGTWKLNLAKSKLTLKKAGKVVQTNREVYSSTLRTITAKGTNESGQPTNNVIVYDRQ